MKPLLEYSALVLGIAISINTIFQAATYYLERRKQRFYFINNITLKIFMILKISEKLASESNKIANYYNNKLNDYPEKSNDRIESIDNFVSNVENINNIELTFNDITISKFLNSEQIRRFCDFLSTFQELKATINYRANLLKTHEVPYAAVRHIEKSINSKLKTLKEHYSILKGFLNI